MRRTVFAVALVLLCRRLPAEDKNWEVPRDPSTFPIFVCLGQSNMAGGFKESHLYSDNGQYEPATDPVPRVLVYRARAWKPATHPLIKHNKVSFSLPIPFAKKYLQLLGDPEVKVGLVTKAYGGKQIGFFVKGNAMYRGGLSRLKESGTFRGVLWHQGESNTTGAGRYIGFKDNLLGIVRDIRSDLDLPGLPFVTGQLTRMSSNSIPQEGQFGSESCGTITRVLSDLFIGIVASGREFRRGALKSFCILLDGRRLDGKAGNYRFRFRQYGIGKYAHVIVSIYGAGEDGLAWAPFHSQVQGCPENPEGIRLPNAETVTESLLVKASRRRGPESVWEVPL